MSLKSYDVIVVGGGHAGLEAAFAAAHLNAKTLLISLNFKMMGNLPCNPSIGGSAKGIVVREIDALGGMMGKAADKEYLQIKLLNTGKGPGVQCLRAQEDKLGYPRVMQNFVKECPNLDFVEGMVTSLIFDENGVYGVRLENGDEYSSKATILATGTYMESDILIGHKRLRAGPDGEKPSIGLSKYLGEKMGIKIYRLKTGTPPRIRKDTIDYEKTKREDGSPRRLAFSYETTTYLPLEKQYPCYLTYTNLETHKIINDNLEASALFGGLIHSTGPRYCPSIETKVVTFADRERHQLFLEPESRDMNTIYLQGFSTSMPEDVQEKMVHSLVGLEHAEILKYAYAIEYDAIEADEYDCTLNIKKYPGLYIAGQICGTSGYEEAAGLGLVAGVNAVFKMRGKEPFILKRDESYIGVMIDDLTTKGTDEPYRLMSSRAEYRLLLRHDNADMRLTEIGHDIGLISDERYEKFLLKKSHIESACNLLKSRYMKESDCQLFDDIKPLPGTLFSDFLKRPSVKISRLLSLFDELNELSEEELEEVEIMLKYEGYIQNQERHAANMRKLEALKLPDKLDYTYVDGLRLEARQKLNKFMPKTIGQASRISGVNPADISVLILLVKKGELHD